MTPERWRHITDVFHAALARDTAARGAFLEQACGTDSELRGEVGAMLAAHRDAGRFGESAVRDLNRTPPRLEPGASLGPYRIDGLIGAGGMGEVYRAHDSRIGRDVAIKVLPTEYAADAERLRRFEQEARASGALNHPNVLTLYDVGSAADRPYLVMELLDGETLRDRIGRGALTPPRACEVAADVARGLAAAHAKGIVHRDLKPENIMVTRDGRVKILDFGIAKLKAPVPTPDGRTVTTPLRTLAQTVMGTAGYMAPEQARGLPADERADIFALGAILFEMLTGRRAFDRPSQVETLNAILRDDLPPLEGTAALVPPTVERIVRRCVEKEPDARFQSARDLAFALDNSVGTATAATTGVSAPLTRRVLRVREATAFALAAAIIAGLTVWTFTPRAVPGPPPQALARFAIQPPPRTAFQARPAISPDGSLLVYAIDPTTGDPTTGTASGGPVRRLFLRRLDQLDAAALPGTEGGIAPFFSPDGQSVGFVADGKIKKISVTTAAASPVVVVDVKTFLGATFAPDNTIIFGSIEHGLQRVSADGGVPQPITPLDRARAELDHHSPRILPGGKAVLFTIHAGAGRFRVGVQVLATGERKVLIETGFDAQYSPTGHLVYGNGGSLFAVPFSLDRLEVTGAPVKLLDEVETVPSDGGAHFSLSLTGTLVFMPSTPRAGRRLVWLNRSGAVTQMPTEPRMFASPRLSPDGQRLAVSVEAGERQNIWIYQLRNEVFGPVTFEGRNSMPLWTADGMRLTYSSRRGGLQHLFWQPTDGSSPAESLISSENNLYAGGWAPDGRSLVYMDDPPTSNAEIRVLSMAPGRQSELVPGIPTRSTWPALSPDGRWVAFVSFEGRRRDINVQPFPGPGLRRQVVEGGTEPVWSRDGRELFFRSRRGAAPNLTDTGPSDEGIFALPFDPVTGAAAAKPVQLFRGRFAPATWIDRIYDVTPDGQRFVVVIASDEEFAPLHLNVIMNIDDELRRRVPAGK